MGHRDLLVTRTYLRQTPNARVCPREASAGRLSSSPHIGSNRPEARQGPCPTGPSNALVDCFRIRVTRPHASPRRAMRVPPGELPAYEFIADWRILYRGRSLACRIDQPDRKSVV